MIAAVEKWKLLFFTKHYIPLLKGTDSVRQNCMRRHVSHEFSEIFF